MPPGFSLFLSRRASRLKDLYSNLSGCCLSRIINNLTASLYIAFSSFLSRRASRLKDPLENSQAAPLVSPALCALNCKQARKLALYERLL